MWYVKLGDGFEECGLLRQWIELTPEGDVPDGIESEII